MMWTKFKNQLKKIGPLYRFYRGRKKRRFVQNEQSMTKEIPGVFGRVHKYDFMIAGDSPVAIEGYNRIGLSACHLIEQSLAFSGLTIAEITSLLDFGCGYGRVLRALVQRVDPEKISVFDVDSGAALFCAEEFHVKPLYFPNKNRWNFNSVPFESYDVIWLGSVFTHISKRYLKETLKLLYRILKPNGLLIFTTHGEQTFPRLQEGFYGNRFQTLARKIKTEVKDKGFSFIPYKYEEIEILPFYFARARDFGMSWMSQEFIDKLIQDIFKDRLKQRIYLPLGWENHQDVYSFQRLPY